MLADIFYQIEFRKFVIKMTNLSFSSWTRDPPMNMTSGRFLPLSFEELKNCVLYLLNQPNLYLGRLLP
jgi:hypothetical protein